MVSIRQVLINLICETRGPFAGGNLKPENDWKTNRLQKMGSGFEARRMVLRQAFENQNRGHTPQGRGDSHSPSDLEATQ